MHLVLKNNLTVHLDGIVDYIAVKKLFIVDNPEYTKARQRGLSTYGVDRHIELYTKLDPYDYVITVPRNGICEVIQYAKKFNKNYTLADYRQEGIEANFGPLSEKFKLRPEQEAAVAAVEKENGILVAGAGCVDCDTEFFTGTEWKRIADYEVGDKVLQYNENAAASLVEPIRYIKEKEDMMFRMKTKYGIDQVLSVFHDVVYVNYGYNGGFSGLLKKPFYEVIEAHEKNINGFRGLIPTVFTVDKKSRLEIEDVMLMLQVAVIADSTILDSGMASFNLKKLSKVVRLLILLEQASLHYSYTIGKNGYHRINFRPIFTDKIFDKKYYNCSKRQLKIIFDAVVHWEGSESKREYYTTIKESADFIQYCGTVCGYTSTIFIDDRRGRKKGKYTTKCIGYTVNFINTQFRGIRSRTKSEITEYIPTDGFKYCFEVPSGMLVLRRNNNIFITGNSGKTVMALEYANRKSRLTLWITHTQDLLYQAAQRAQQMFPEVGEIGIIGDGKMEFGFGNLIVSTFQSLNKSENLINELNQFVGTVIIDEVHHAPSPFFDGVINSFNARNVLGLTATPERKDRLEMKMFLSVGNIIHKVDRVEQYRENKLVKPKVVFIYTGVTHDDIAENSYGYDAGGEDLDYLALMYSVLAVEKRLNLIAENIIKCVAMGKKYQLVLSEYVSYAYALSDKVNELLKEGNYCGVRTEVIHGPIPTYTWKRAHSKAAAIAAVEKGEALEFRKDKNGRRYKIKVYNYPPEKLQEWKITGKQRKQILEDCQDRKVNILFATKLAREGLDIKHLEVGHVTTPKRGDTYQRSDGAGIEQEIGRIMRPDPLNADKNPIWYDYVDYDIEIFKSQYYSRRKVYGRLGLNMPKKKKTELEVTEDMLSSINLFS
jgi:superfamily II DNA or RNA helicase